MRDTRQASDHYAKRHPIGKENTRRLGGDGLTWLMPGALGFGLWVCIDAVTELWDYSGWFSEMVTYPGIQVFLVFDNKHGGIPEDSRCT